MGLLEYSSRGGVGQGSILMQYILFISKTKIKMHHEDVMGYVYSIDEADRK